MSARHDPGSLAGTVVTGIRVPVHALTSFVTTVTAQRPPHQDLLEDLLDLEKSFKNQQKEVTVVTVAKNKALGEKPTSCLRRAYVARVVSAGPRLSRNTKPRERGRHGGGTAAPHEAIVSAMLAAVAVATGLALAGATVAYALGREHGTANGYAAGLLAGARLTRRLDAPSRAKERRDG